MAEVDQNTNLEKNIETENSNLNVVLKFESVRKY